MYTNKLGRLLAAIYLVANSPIVTNLIFHVRQYFVFGSFMRKKSKLMENQVRNYGLTSRGVDEPLSQA